jgi:enamine deaminase RidA (YjgF/YER057c/UK114 family)
VQAGQVRTVVRNPASGVYAATPDYVHAMEVQNPGRLLFVSGTMGLDITGNAGKTLAEQLELVWSNIRTILGSAEMTVDNVVRVTSYLRDARFAEANQNARVAALQGRVVPTTTIVVETLAPDWFVEVEVVAAA